MEDKNLNVVDAKINMVFHDKSRLIQCQQAIFHADSQEARDRAMQAMLKMKKIVIKDLYSPQAL